MSETGYTCNTCGVMFQEAEYQREHMRTDWHRYNLKRRVAGLPPIPSDIFAEKMVQQQSMENSEDANKSSRRQVTKKDLKRQEQARRRLEGGSGKGSRNRSDSANSGMSKASLGAPGQSEYDTDNETDFIASVADGLQTATLDEADEERAVAEEEEMMIQEKLANMVKFPVNVCFMDGHVSDTVEDNVKYLEFKYGMVIPEPKFVSDLSGLIQYLNEKVGLGNCCLSCNFMGRSLDAARDHMLAKQHVKIPYEHDAQRDELADFYDFSASYGQGANDGWEDVEDGEVGETDSRVVVNGDDETALAVSEITLSADGYELNIAPGVNAGHRALNRYYKQRYAGLSAPKEGQSATKMIDYRSPGVGEKEAEQILKAQWRAEKKQNHADLRNRWHVNFQKHYRDELLQ